MAAVGSIGVLAVLVVLLARPPSVLRGRPEVLVAAPAAFVVVLFGWESLDAVGDAVRELAPTLAFLVGVLLIAAACEAAGLFDLVGERLAGLAARGDGWLVAGVGALAFAVTAVLSLDATVVLFTPVVVRLVRGRRAADPALLATVLIANAGSLALPVANLTNLLVLERTGIGWGTFTAHLLLPALVATAVVVAVCVRGAARSVAVPAAPAAATEAQPVGWVGAVVAVGTVLALVGFFVAAAAGAQPWWVALPIGVVLGLVVLAAGRTSPASLLRRSSPDFVLFVVALAVVVEAAASHGLDRVADWAPTGEGLLALAGMALLATVLANAMNNLPATLLLLPVLAHRPAAIALAALIGLNVGPNLTYPGSLATLLWRRVTAGAGVEPSRRAFYRASLASTPIALGLAVVLLWASF